MRLATFNILNGRSLNDGRVDERRFADAVRSLDADVLGLQEVDRGQPRSQHADLTAVAAEAMGAVDHRFVPALVGTPGERWTAPTGGEPADAPAYGVALLSRHPVRDWRILRLPALPGRAPYVWPGNRFPDLVRDEPRAAVFALVATPHGEVTVATTHLSFLPGWNRLQLRRVVRALRARPAPRVLMGDLNMPLRSAARVSGLPAAVEAPTFPVRRPTRQIDHVLVEGLPQTFLPARGEARDLGLSDHCALVVDLG